MSPNENETSPILSKRIILSASIVSAIAAAAVLLFRQHQPWVEVVGKDLLRTNAPSQVVASARDAVIRSHQNWLVDENGKRSDPSYQGGARTWNVGSSPEATRLSVIRSKTQITDQHAHTLSIESISASGTPTLIFIDYDLPSEIVGIANEFVNEFMKRGVKVR